MRHYKIILFLVCGQLLEAAAAATTKPATEKLDDKIIGGREAFPREFPWQAALVKGSLWLSCGAVVVKPDIILTAAHCIRDGRMDVMAGSLNIHDREGQNGAQVRREINNQKSHFTDCRLGESNFELSTRCTLTKADRTILQSSNWINHLNLARILPRLSYRNKARYLRTNLMYPVGVFKATGRVTNIRTRYRPSLSHL